MQVSHHGPLPTIVQLRSGFIGEYSRNALWRHPKAIGCNCTRGPKLECSSIISASAGSPGPHLQASTLPSMQLEAVMARPNVIIFLAQSVVQLSAATKWQIQEAEAGEKEKSYLFECWMTWENGELPIWKLISSAKSIQNPNLLNKTKTNGSTQNSCSIESTMLLNARWLLSGDPGSLACTKLYLAWGSLMEAVCYASAHNSHVSSVTPRSYIPCQRAREHVNTLAPAPPGWWVGETPSWRPWPCNC